MENGVGMFYGEESILWQYVYDGRQINLNTKLMYHL